MEQYTDRTYNQRHRGAKEMWWSMYVSFNKRLHAAVILLLVVVLAAGCSKVDTLRSGEQEAKPKVDSRQVQLQVWGDLGNQFALEASFRRINENFMKLHPNIRINYKFVQTPESLDFGVLSNELPDIFYVQGNKTTKMRELALNGYLLPLDDYGFDLRRYPEGAVQYGTIEGKLYSSLPAFMDTQLVYYNEDIFKRYKLDPPRTWDEFVKLLDVLVSKGVTPISMPGTEYKERSWLSYVFMALFASEKSEALMNDKPGVRLTDPEFVQGLQAFRDFAEKNYFGRDYVTQDRVEWQLSFTNGAAAMIVDGSWNNLLYENSGVNVGKFYVPDSEGKRIAPISYNNWTTYSISRNTKYPEQAVEYLKYLNSSEAQQLLGDATGMIPILEDIEPQEAIQDLMNYDRAVDNFTTIMAHLSKRDMDAPALYRQTVLAKLLTSKLNGQEAAELLETGINYIDDPDKTNDVTNQGGSN
ncbi:ABC transporter substrate-binding protein [Paenibacillus sp. YIM B09110]|uniref:ABC transporter substrate-binding protein n=1 Tax=Paenibacillus sp. YIM B09110 TaxID=3126102 RepID=UPI00301B7A11